MLNMHTQNDPTAPMPPLYLNTRHGISCSKPPTPVHLIPNKSWGPSYDLPGHGWAPCPVPGALLQPLQTCSCSQSSDTPGRPPAEGLCPAVLSAWHGSQTCASLPRLGSLLKGCLHNEDVPGQATSDSSVTATCALLFLLNFCFLELSICSHKLYFPNLSSISSPPLKYTLREDRYAVCFAHCCIPVPRTESGVTQAFVEWMNKWRLEKWIF